jgi:hypothetical protein
MATEKPESVLVKIPGRLRPFLDEVCREEYRRSHGDAVRSILERAIVERRRGLNAAG